jgi:4-nitrophenyl phosphatase
MDELAANAILRPIRAVISDLDDTLARGHVALPGLAAFHALLMQRRIGFTVVTNNTTRTPAQYAARLAGFGVALAPEQVLTASVATAAYLKAHFDAGAPLFVIGEPGLRTELEAAGFRLSDGAAGPVAAVVVGGDRGLTYAALKTAVRHILRGAVFIGTNPDLLVPDEDELVPEAGVNLAALQAATGMAPLIIGKPKRPLLDLAMARMGSTPANTAILGDRAETDIAGGKRLGLTTILLTNGVDDAASAAAKGFVPDIVAPGLDTLAAWWRGGERAV